MKRIIQALAWLIFCIFAQNILAVEHPLSQNTDLRAIRDHNVDSHSVIEGQIYTISDVEGPTDAGSYKYTIQSGSVEVGHFWSGHFDQDFEIWEAEGSAVPTSAFTGTWESPLGEREITQPPPDSAYNLEVSLVGGSSSPEFLIRYDEAAFDFYDEQEEWAATAIIVDNQTQGRLELHFNYGEDSAQEIWTMPYEDGTGGYNPTGGGGSDSPHDTDDDVPTLLDILAELVETNQNLTQTPVSIMDQLEEDFGVDVGNSEAPWTNAEVGDMFADQEEGHFDDTITKFKEFKTTMNQLLELDTIFNEANFPADAPMPKYDIIETQMTGQISIDLNDPIFTNIIAMCKIGLTGLVVWWLGWWVFDRISMQIAS